MTEVAPNQDSAQTLVSTNPAKGFEVLGEVIISSEATVKEKVAQAHLAQKSWARLDLEKRIDYMQALKAAIEKNAEKFAHMMTQEMGMPLKLSTRQVSRSADLLEWNCAHVGEALAPKRLYEDDAQVNEMIYEPYGVMACVVAWNFPLPNFVLATSQALLAGNTLVMKYSEEVPLFSRFLEQVIADCGFPEGVINFVYGDGSVGAILTGQDVDIISFTGSSATGKKIYQKAAEKLIPATLELGGSSPGVVFEDCVVDDALIDKIFWGRFTNSAQFCSNLKRLIVHNSLLDEVLEKLTTYTNTKIVGDPFDQKTDVGPLVAQRQVVTLEKQLQDALDKGAKLHCGGSRPKTLKGAYFEPTILSNISKDMKVWVEEVFGPVLPVIGFDTYEEAIDLANDTEYGLTAYVYTSDKELGKQAMHDIKAGEQRVNSASPKRSQNPFGGHKNSGVSFQGGIEGFHRVCQIKVIAWEK